MDAELKRFYDNWYFYQTYKNKTNSKDFDIRYE